MSQYNTLKNAVENAVVWDNGENKITGTILFNVLITIINSIGANFQFVDAATAGTNPGTPDQRVFYIAGPGTYPNFGGTVVKAGELGVFMYGASWSYKTISVVNIVNNLIDGGVNGALSAEQGKVLSAMIAQEATDRILGVQGARDYADSINETTNERIDEQGQEIETFEATIRDIIANYQPIIINGNVTNAPDEEDITAQDDLLKFKNRSALYGLGYFILRRDSTFAAQVTLPNTIYEIRYDFDLSGASVTIPAGCILLFNGGTLKNGSIVFNNTQLINPKLDVRISGSIANDELPISAFVGTAYSNNIADVMNLDNPVTLVFNKNVTLSGSSKSVKRLLLKSDGARRIITDPDKYTITTVSGVSIEQISFVYTAGSQNVVDYTDALVYIGNADEITGVLPIIMRNVSVNGDFRKNYVFKVRPQSTNSPVMRVELIVDSCSFTGLIIGVSDIRCGCFGRVVSTSCNRNGNTIVEGGTRTPSSAFRLGFDYVANDESVMANDFLFDECSFAKQVGGYATGNDVGELHFILLYGNRNTIRNCSFSELSSSFALMQDSGADSEGIYIKGNSCSIYGNKIKDMSGSSADGMINLKGQDYHDNIVVDNSIVVTTTYCPVVFHIGGVRNAIRNNFVEQTTTAVNNEVPIIIYIAPSANMVIEGNEIRIKTCARIFIGANSSIIIRNNSFIMDCPAGYSATLANAMITGAATISTDIIGNRFTLKNFAASLSLFNPSQKFVGNTFILDGIASTRDAFNFQYNVGVFANNEISINNSSFRRVLYKAAQDVMIADNIINISAQDTGINAKIVDKASAAAWSIADVICNNIIRGYKEYTLPDGVTAQNNVVVTLTP